MKKSQLFPIIGFLLGWGAPLGALVLEFVGRGFPAAPLAFLDEEWAREPFLYWYMLGGTSLVLAGVGYILGRLQDAEDLRNTMRVDEAIRDALTGLATHRRLHEVFASAYRRHLDSRQPLSCLMLDLDEFRKVNEAYGYAFGDTILREFAQLLRNGLRQGDTAARYGGEEFFCILPDCSEANAMAVAERLRTETERLVFPLGKAPVKITVSIGAVTVHDVLQPDYFFLVAETDKNLYKAKTQGRNCTVQSVFHEMVGAGR